MGNCSIFIFTFTIVVYIYCFTLLAEIVSILYSKNLFCYRTQTNVQKVKIILYLRAFRKEGLLFIVDVNSISQCIECTFDDSTYTLFKSKMVPTELRTEFHEKFIENVYIWCICVSVYLHATWLDVIAAISHVVRAPCMYCTLYTAQSY